MMASLSRIWAMTIKEFAHVSRDPFVVLMALGVPMVMVLIFGTAFEFNLYNIPLAIHDEDETTASRQLIQAFTSSGHFLPKYLSNANLARLALDRDQVKAALIIKPGFERELGSQGHSLVQVLVDGSDSTAASSVLSYLPLIQKKAISSITGLELREPINVVTRYNFNAQLSTKWFIVPGLGVVIMALISVLLTSLTIAKEWESGSMELLLSTPVRPIEIIIGKLAPYLILGLLGALLVYLSARLIFGVPFRGDLWPYFWGCFFFVTTCMAQGLLISVTTRTQQIATQGAMMSGLLPSIYLSGFIYPIEHMPEVLQKMTGILAPRWFMQISHDLYLKGTNWAELAGPFIGLVAICLFFIGLAAVNFKKDVEP